MSERIYTTRLQAGLGMVDETDVLLDLWREEFDSMQLCQAALESGRLRINALWVIRV